MHAVAFSVKRAHLRTVHHLQRHATRFGLTPARYDMLLAIASGIASLQRDLWRIFHVSRTTVSRMVRALEALGLVCRARIPGTPSRIVRVTEKGRLLMDAAITGCHRPITRLFESLYPTFRRRLARATQVASLYRTVGMLAAGFGDRSRMLHESPDHRYDPLDVGGRPDTDQRAAAVDG
jgi:DNA-binding MarR family transcriptional regulator